MPTLDTSNWFHAGIWPAETTASINAFATNGTNQWTLHETSARFTSGATRYWSAGMSLVNSPGDTNGSGKVVRPPQRITLPLTGGGHVHYVFDLQELRLYASSVNEGGSTSTVPTGVIGLGFEVYRFSSTPDGTLPTGNDAQVELDIVVYSPSDTDSYAALSNFTLSTTGLGTIWDPNVSNPVSVVWRGALGVSRFDRTFLFHNTQSNAWTWTNWNLQSMFTLGGPRYLGWRLHSPVAPYYLGHTVPTATPQNILAQQGIYDNTPSGTDIQVSVNGTIRAQHNVQVVQTNTDATNHQVQVAGRVRSEGEVVSHLSRRHATPVNGRVRAQQSIGGGEHHRVSVRGYVDTLTDLTTVIADRTQGGVLGEVRAASSIRIEGVQPDDPDDGSDSGGDDGFLQTAGRALWRMLGLRG